MPAWLVEYRTFRNGTSNLSRRRERHGRKAMRALIVDDSMFIREYLKQMLERMNVQC